MPNLIINTQNLVNISELRKNLSKFINRIQDNKEAYFVITENSKVVSIIINPELLNHVNVSGNAINLEEIRETNWSRNTGSIQNALQKLNKVSKNKLPKLFR